MHFTLFRKGSLRKNARAGGIVGLFLGASLSLAPSPAFAGCESVGAPPVLFGFNGFSQPCPIWDPILRTLKKSSDIQAAKSLVESAQQLKDTINQSMNAITLLRQLNPPRFPHIQPFTTVSFSGLSFTAGNSMQSMFQGYLQSMTRWYPGTTYKSANIDPVALAIRMATTSIAHAVREQQYDNDSDTNDMTSLTTAVTSATTLAEDIGAGTAINIKMIQEQQMRNTLLANLLGAEASYIAAPMTPKPMAASSSPYTTIRSGGQETETEFPEN